MNTSMSEHRRKVGKVIATALLTRYPFWRSISFLLFLSDLVQLKYAKNSRLNFIIIIIFFLL